MFLIVGKRRVHLQPIDSDVPLCGHLPDDCVPAHTDRVVRDAMREVNAIPCKECEKALGAGAKLWAQANREVRRLAKEATR